MGDHDRCPSPDEGEVSDEQDVGRQAVEGQGDWYAFRVRGHLAPCWSEGLGGLAIANLEDGDTLLTGLVADQAALHGLLVKVRDLNLPLISVNRIEPGRPDVPRTGDAEKKTLS